MVRNCLTHALDKWSSEGGYVVWRRSKHWSCPHMIHVDVDGRISSYVPPANLEHPLQSLVGFEGEIRDADPVDLARPMTTWGIVGGVCLLFGGVLVWVVSRWWRRCKRLWRRHG